MRDLYNKMSKGVFAIFSAGMIDIVCAGTLLLHKYGLSGLSLKKSEEK